ncbi:MAG: M81 family metallopeptidase [Candidatus Latescibacteria bacterium]|nr:M81 family metallopeptidase [Candidatus Latescibacterota bacterium]
MKRVLIATFMQETGSFNPKPTIYEDFNILRGREILDAFRQSGGSTRGTVEVLDERSDIEIVPTYAAWTGTGGPVSTADLDRMIAELLETVENESNIDGVCLALHGAMAGESEDDPEGRVIDGIRKHVGDVPLTASMDLHGIITDRIIEGTDAISFLHTYPHIDQQESGARAAQNLLKMLDGEVKNPVTARVQIPMLARGNELITKTGKFGEAIRMCQAFEATPNGVAAGVNIGNPFTDVPDLRSNTIVTTDGDEARAQEEALKLAHFMWDNRNLWFADLMSMQEIVEKAEAQDGLTVCGDPADSTASGASGDSNAILKGLLENNYSKRALIFIVDTPTVARAFEAGVGSTITVPLGGSIDTERFTPLEAEVYVQSLSDGVHGRGPVPGRAGRTAKLKLNQHTVVASERAAATTSSSFFLSQGENPTDYDFVIAKSPNGFRTHYEPFASQIVYADVPGSTSANLKTLPYKRCPRPIFPLDENVEAGF